MNVSRVLLMYISEVSGHRQATVAIEKSLRLLKPDIEIMSLNGFGYVYPIIEKIVNKAYMGVIKRTPKVWDYLYDNPRVVQRLQSIKDAIYKANHAKLAKLFEEFRPDVVVCTQAFPCGMVADYKQSHHLNVKVIGVLTDYAPHSYWLHEGVDYYVVPSEAVGKRLAEKGVAEHRIKPFGIPVDPKFTAPHNKQEVFEKLGLDSALPTVLIMGGGQGLGPIKNVVTSLINSDIRLQLVILAGINKKLIAWLKKIQAKSPKKIISYEYTNNVEELMEAATLIVTKPGGMTTAEALVKGLPMVIARPLPGQEMHNTDCLLKAGVAVHAGSLERIGKDVEALLEDPNRIAEMRRTAFQISKPQSSFDIARLILS